MDKRSQEAVEAATALFNEQAAEITRLKADNERLKEWMAEIQMNGHQWMVAHDKLKAGKPYDLPKPADLPETVKRLVEDNERLTEATIKCAASLAAAISLLERGGKAAKKAAPSDKMFDQMLTDYRRALDAARATLKENDRHD